jgi:hypothetical protein
MSNAVTIIPANYPELEAETYASLDFPTERATRVPSAEEQSGLQVDCLLGDRDPVEIEVDAMFWEQNEAAITAADMREGLTFRLSQRDE